MRHILYLRWLKSKKMIRSVDTLHSSGQIYYLLVEIIIILLLPYPFLDSKIYI